MTSERELAPDPAQSEHIPVLLHEIMSGLALQAGMQTIDCTIGGGGHAQHILNQTAPGGRLLGLDADPAAIRRVALRLAEEVEQDRLVLARSQFVDLEQAARENHFEQVDGILLDLGVSSFQLETAARGFSFLHPGPLDMRFDPDQELDASGIVNHWDENEIADLIYTYGEERQSRRIARSIVHNRPIETTEQLVNVITKAVGYRREQRIHPATRTFQALRIAVNREGWQ
jgi:16S rRNA (cytosine1402-N4)-methyltransferase